MLLLARPLGKKAALGMMQLQAPLLPLQLLRPWQLLRVCAGRRRF
jgi:hypothetical protein